MLDELPRGIPRGVRAPSFDRAEIDEHRGHASELNVERRCVLQVEPYLEQALPQREGEKASGFEERVRPLPRVTDDIDRLDGEH